MKPKFLDLGQQNNVRMVLELGDSPEDVAADLKDEGYDPEHVDMVIAEHTVKPTE